MVAADRNWAIGKDGDQLVYLREDLRRFRALTLGGCVIMGRRTLEALPGGRPLAGRRNLVLSGDPAFAPAGAEVCRSVEEALAAAPEDAFVIGGASVYRALLPWCSEAYVTRLDGAFPADRWFPDLDSMADWRAADRSGLMEEGGVRYRYVTYRRIG